MAWLQDYTLMRGLSMDFPGDANVYNIADQYMFGPSLMVCPVYVYKARTRDVYFPAPAGWFDFYSGKFIAGNQRLPMAAPYERMPLFVKSGSIIPVGPDLEYSMEKPADPVTLFVYTGSDARFMVYEDENINYNYEKGKFATIPITYDENTGTLVIGKRKGAFPGMLRERTFKVVWVTTNRPVGFDPDRKPDAVIRYSGERVEVRKQGID
jgi:alpha-D-xyloside xylohydrolase